MAESVDALVSNTNDSNVVPVRPRLRVHRGLNFSPLFFLQNRLQNQMNPIPKFERPSARHRRPLRERFSKVRYSTNSLDTYTDSNINAPERTSPMTVPNFKSVTFIFVPLSRMKASLLLIILDSSWLSFRLQTLFSLSNESCELAARHCWLVAMVSPAFIPFPDDPHEHSKRSIAEMRMSFSLYLSF